MSERAKSIMKGLLALALALAMVLGMSVWMKDSRLKADEEAPEAEVIAEEATVVEVIELAYSDAEPVIVVQEIVLPEE